VINAIIEMMSEEYRTGGSSFRHLKWDRKTGILWRPFTGRKKYYKWLPDLRDLSDSMGYII